MALLLRVGVGPVAELPWEAAGYSKDTQNGNQGVQPAQLGDGVRDHGAVAAKGQTRACSGCPGRLGAPDNGATETTARPTRMVSNDPIKDYMRRHACGFPEALDALAAQLGPPTAHDIRRALQTLARAGAPGSWPRDPRRRAVSARNVS